MKVKFDKNVVKRLKELKDKYAEIINELEIERANATSDDSENVHYIIVEKEFILKQIKILERRLKNKNKYKNNVSSESKIVALGTCVRLVNHTHTLEICVVNHDDAQPDEGHISDISPIGQAIIGKNIGDKVLVNSPSGKIPYTIEKFL